MKLNQTNINLPTIPNTADSTLQTAIPESDFLMCFLENINAESDLILPIADDKEDAFKETNQINQTDDLVSKEVVPDELLSEMIAMTLQQPVPAPPEPVLNQETSEVNQTDNNFLLPQEFNQPSKEMDQKKETFDKTNLEKVKLEFSPNPNLLIKEENTIDKPVIEMIKKSETIKPITESKSPAYSNFFTELSNMINHQISNQLPQNQNLTATPEKLFVQGRNQVNEKYELKIELLPPSMDSINKEVYEAKLKIYPPELGTISAKLKVNKNNAELTMVAENSRVQAIIEANLPQLRENFKQMDINLTHIQIDTLSSNQKDQTFNDQNESNKPFLNNDFSESNLNQSKALPESKTISNKLIDTYA